MLRRGGVKPDNIITMMYDDIAHNQQNPHPGKIFNRPNGENVYVDIPIVSCWRHALGLVVGAGLLASATVLCKPFALSAVGAPLPRPARAA